MTSRPGEFYTIRHNHEWAIIGLDESTGAFFALSSFGTYAYCWSHRGPVSLKAFLADLDYDYFMTKAFGPGRLEFDGAATVADMKQTIRRRRLERRIDAATARELYSETERLDSIWNEGGFYREIQDCDALMQHFGSDLTELSRTRDNPQCRGFWEQIWPTFLEQIAPKPRPWHHRWVDWFKRNLAIMGPVHG